MLRRDLPKTRIFEPFFWVYYIWYYLPLMRAYFRSTRYNQLFFGIFLCGVLLFLFEICKKRQRIYLKFNALVPVLAYFALFFVFVLFDVQTASRHIRVSFTFWGTLIIYYFMDEYPNARKRLATLMFLMFAVTAITSLVGVIANPNAARVLTFAANEIEEDLMLRRMNIGGISFFQGLCICVPVLMTFIYQKKYRILSCLMLIMIWFSLLAASFTISLTMFFVALLLGYFSNNTTAKKTLAAVLVLLVVMAIPWGELLFYLSSVIDNETISVRLTSMATSIINGSASGNLGSRIQVYEMSLNSFLENPAGIGPQYTYVTGQRGIGYHSQFLDDLARYGILGLVFYATFFGAYYKLLRKQWSKIQMEQVAGAITLIYFCFLILNLGFTAAHESVLMLFLMPAFPDLLQGRQQKKQAEFEKASERIL